MKPICVKCQRFYRCKQNGFYFIEGMPIGPGRAESGTAEPEKWKPYKLWVGDLWKCEGCGHEAVSGVCSQPLAEHYQPDFPKAVADFGAKLIINDC